MVPISILAVDYSIFNIMCLFIYFLRDDVITSVLTADGRAIFDLSLKLVMNNLLDAHCP